MTRDDIIKLAREAGMHRSTHNLASNPVQYRYSYDGYEENLERFAALVAAAEREACSNHYLGIMRGAIAEEREACAHIADQMTQNSFLGAVGKAIRARGQQ